MKRSQVLVLHALVCEQPPSTNGVDRSWSTRRIADFLNDRHGDADNAAPFTERAVRCSLQKFRRDGVVWHEGDNWHVDGRQALLLVRKYLHNPVFGAACQEVAERLKPVVRLDDPLRMIFQLLGDRFEDEQVAVIKEVLDRVAQ